MKTLFALLFFATALSAAPLDLPAPGDTSVTVNGLFDRQLKNMAEPGLLSRMGQPIEEYRLLYVPSFERTFSVRVTKSGDSISMRAVMLSGRGFQPGRIVVERSRALTVAEWEKFQTLLAAASYWQRPAIPQVNMRDGSAWVFEGTGQDRYRMLYVRTPTSKADERGLGSFIECGNYLVTLSGLQLEKPME